MRGQRENRGRVLRAGHGSAEKKSEE
jgi:hypothetical protein